MTAYKREGIPAPKGGAQSAPGDLKQKKSSRGRLRRGPVNITQGTLAGR